MTKKPIPKRCRDCLSLWTFGIKQGGHDRWCAHFSNEASKVQAQCIQSGAKRTKEV